MWVGRGRERIVLEGVDILFVFSLLFVKKKTAVLLVISL